MKSEIDASESIRVRLVLNPDNRGWILEKFATRLASNLSQWNVNVYISDQISSKADFNHFMLYHYCTCGHSPYTTFLITHVDHPKKLKLLKASIAAADIGICLSRQMMADLVQRGLPPEKLCYILPAHDGQVALRRIVIGITSRMYGDGRKREWLLVKLAKTMRLDAFHFVILGQGWDTIITHLLAAGATIDYDPGTDDYVADYQRVQERLPTFDYYLYTGMDEGSMGFLDALAAGVSTIVTPQGFHLDVTDGITHPFVSFAELLQVFETIGHKCRRLNESVRHLTWGEYARQHVVVWRALMKGQRHRIPALLDAGRKVALPPHLVQRPQSNLFFYGRPALRRLWRMIRPSTR
jgi:hypothetical protein